MPSSGTWCAASSERLWKWVGGILLLEEFRALVTEARPGAASMLAPARGLCLMKVRYESGLFDDETHEDI